MITLRFSSSKRETYFIQVPSESYINDIKSSLASEVKASVDQIVLLSKGKVLKQNCPFSSLNYDLGKDFFLFRINQTNAAASTSSPPVVSSSSVDQNKTQDAIPQTSSPPSIPIHVPQIPNNMKALDSPTKITPKNNETDINSLAEMGFQRDSVIDALRRADGNIDEASNILLLKSHVSQSNFEMIMSFGFRIPFLINAFALENDNDAFKTLQFFKSLKDQVNEDPKSFWNFADSLSKINPQYASRFQANPHQFCLNLGIDVRKVLPYLNLQKTPGNSTESANVDVNSKAFQDAISSLVELGFKREEVIAALVSAKGNPNEAYTLIVSQKPCCKN